MGAYWETTVKTWEHTLNVTTRAPRKRCVTLSRTGNRRFRHHRAKPRRGGRAGEAVRCRPHGPPGSAARLNAGRSCGVSARLQSVVSHVSRPLRFKKEHRRSRLPGGVQSRSLQQLQYEAAAENTCGTTRNSDPHTARRAARRLP